MGGGLEVNKIGIVGGTLLFGLFDIALVRMKFIACYYITQLFQRHSTYTFLDLLSILEFCYLSLPACVSQFNRRRIRRKW
jgi:hypothetical protein